MLGCWCWCLNFTLSHRYWTAGHYYETKQQQQMEIHGAKARNWAPARTGWGYQNVWSGNVPHLPSPIKDNWSLWEFLKPAVPMVEEILLVTLPLSVMAGIAMPYLRWRSKGMENSCHYKTNKQTQPFFLSPQSSRAAHSAGFSEHYPLCVWQIWWCNNPRFVSF